MLSPLMRRFFFFFSRLLPLTENPAHYILEFDWIRLISRDSVVCDNLARASRGG